jgi:hypothetical protein
MAADAPREDGPASGETIGNPGQNNSFTGTLTTAQLVAEIGRCLQSQLQAFLNEPLPEELATLVRQLQEREGEGS